NSCFNKEGDELLRFSKAFIEKLEVLKNRDYEIYEVKINFILFWEKEETGREIKIILPEIYLTKNQSKKL
ncbi:MAG: hypothetical protein GXO47_05525, partial [Chlorobi bacterium]|nr:hypothetical protein [Chlorobiota bacterium]